MERKPRIFIGSSVESLNIADAVNLNLDHTAEVTLWRNGTFDLSNNTIDSLMKKAKSVDFALFVFSPDDMAIIKDQTKHIVRDNVLFELGLFIGSIGKERCFILKPRNIDLHFPTDLLGVTPADYEPNRSDNDLASAVNHACALIKKQMEKFQLLQIVATTHDEQRTGVCVNRLKSIDYKVLKALLITATEAFEGLGIYSVRNNLNDNSHSIDLAVIRLERLGFIEKKIETDMNGNGYLVYNITEDGIELLLETEDDETLNQKQNQSAPSFVPEKYDDGIPF